MYRELLQTFIRIVILLGATWFLLSIDANKMDGEYATGVYIVVFVVILEALDFAPGKVIRTLVRRLMTSDR